MAGEARNSPANWRLYAPIQNPRDTDSIFGGSPPLSPTLHPIDIEEDFDHDDLDSDTYIDNDFDSVTYIDDDDDLSTLQLSRYSSHSDGESYEHLDDLDLDPDDSTPTQASFPPRESPTSLLPSSSMTATTPQRSGVSPSSSPRLPSPPPFTEVQIGPKSPTIGDANLDLQFAEAARINDGASRRIRPGTKAADMAAGPPLVPLNQLDSPFQLQEHLKALHNTYTRTSSGNTTPITRETALLLANPPQAGGSNSSEPSISVDRHLWLYELCRFLTMKANNLIVAFFAESPPCSAQTCPEMRASEWQYLCAVHDPPKSCCAIDYCCHTLDWATNILTSPKYFPSRLTLGGEGGNVGAIMRHLTNIFRRVYRIFAHAWFQHKGVFWQVEGSDGLYIFFKTVCDVYQLIPEDNYTIPPEAEGTGEEEVNANHDTSISVTGPGGVEVGGSRQILTRSGTAENGSQIAQPHHETGDLSTTTVSVGATTRRHKHTPSTGSHVTTIAEGTEEEDSPASSPLRKVEDEDEQVTGTTDLQSPIAQQSPERRQIQNKPTMLSDFSLSSNGIGRLDLSAESLPDLRAPEDPTPIATQTSDPMEYFGKTATEGLEAEGIAEKDHPKEDHETKADENVEEEKKVEEESKTLEVKTEKSDKTESKDSKPTEDTKEVVDSTEGVVHDTSEDGEPGEAVEDEKEEKATKATSGDETKEEPEADADWEGV